MPYNQFKNSLVDLSLTMNTCMFFLWITLGFTVQQICRPVHITICYCHCIFSHNVQWQFIHWNDTRMRMLCTNSITCNTFYTQLYSLSLKCSEQLLNCEAVFKVSLSSVHHMHGSQQPCFLSMIEKNTNSRGQFLWLLFTNKLLILHRKMHHDKEICSIANYTSSRSKFSM